MPDRRAGHGTDGHRIRCISSYAQTVSIRATFDREHFLRWLERCSDTAKSGVSISKIKFLGESRYGVFRFGETSRRFPRALFFLKKKPKVFVNSGNTIECMRFFMTRLKFNMTNIYLDFVYPYIVALRLLRWSVGRLLSSCAYC